MGLLGWLRVLISIHALLAESDQVKNTLCQIVNNFYPRSPCGERHVQHRPGYAAQQDFYPRSPCGERRLRKKRSYRHTNFYPRSPCGERPYQHVSQDFRGGYFYPRSPCGERLSITITITCIVPFLSTLSLRRATSALVFMICPPRDFYPRSPCGERLTSFVSSAGTTDFYPRSPCGERPAIDVFLAVWAVISIHALLAESDLTVFFRNLEGHNFYPRSPCGERRYTTRSFGQSTLFLSTLSLRRATLAGPSGPAFLINFYPRSPCGERLILIVLLLPQTKFLSTLSLRRATYFLT